MILVENTKFDIEGEDGGVQRDYVLKSLTDNFVFPSEALLKISLNLSNRSMNQLCPFLHLSLTFKKRRNSISFGYLG